VNVLGIDPGTATCGYGIVHSDGGRLRVVDYGSWSTAAGDPAASRLRCIRDEVTALIERHAPASAALEESYVGADARIALFVGQARGVVLVACADAGLDCAEYPPATVKQAVCGYGRADKAQVQRMVKAILGLESKPTPNHAADALAVAICHALAPPLTRIAEARR
jgi:crossover junction endodeoxyribonuclease RuvC